MDLEKLSLLLVIVGIIALYFISIMIKPTEIEISKIDDSLLGNKVIVSGIIKDPKITEHVFFSLCESEACIDVIVFESEARKQPDIYKIKSSEYATVKGEVSLYKNELEIIGEEIKITA